MLGDIIVRAFYDARLNGFNRIVWGKDINEHMPPPSSFA